MSIVIRVENLSKRYRLGVIGSTTLASDLNRWWARLRGRPDPTLKIGQEDQNNHDGEYVWALKDINFEVKQGEILGIIGRNGAGKSTLLKILTRITAPTTGTVKAKGRVASLLEVGTGFHPELTGRENVFLNGAILGMSKSEINNKFEEIVNFAEIETFIDTPVKRYSSGMYVRLAFAVAAHLESEILLIDEVLAVGDLTFQRKCLGKMGEVAKGGRTVFFVSHNMGTVTRLCGRAILLRSGELSADGIAHAVIAEYTTREVFTNKTRIDLREYTNRSGDGSARIIEASILDSQGREHNYFSITDPICILFSVEYQKQSETFTHCIEILNSDGTPIYHIWDIDVLTSNLQPVNQRLIRVLIKNANLVPDQYFVNLWVGDTQGNRADRVFECLSFSIENTDPEIRRTVTKNRGLIFKMGEWTHEIIK
jgi:lipopolysaccharide transport system ATP-binding protein